MKKLRIPVYLFLFLLPLSCRLYQYSTDITENDLYNHMQNLSADALQGRYPGTDGDIDAGRYLEEQFTSLDYLSGNRSFPLFSQHQRT